MKGRVQTLKGKSRLNPNHLLPHNTMQANRLLVEYVGKVLGVTSDDKVLAQVFIQIEGNRPIHQCGE